jgi:serine acetyltransferase
VSSTIDIDEVVVRARPSAVVIDNLKVGADVRIHAGSVVVARIKDGVVVSGNPARKFDLG